MYPTFRVAFLSVGICVCATALGAQLQGSLQAKYDVLSKAFGKKDLAPFEKAIGPKFVLIGLNGSKIDRKTLLADYKRQMDRMSDISWIRTVEKPISSGSTTTATVKAHFKGSLSLQGKKQIFEVVGSNRDTWIKKGSDWILIKSQVLTLEATMDGRPLPRG